MQSSNSLLQSKISTLQSTLQSSYLENARVVEGLRGRIEGLEWEVERVGRERLEEEGRLREEVQSLTEGERRQEERSKATNAN